VTTVLVFLSAAMLGVMVGALLTEALVLVPFWRSLPAAGFLQWYRDNGRLLLQFYGPLEVVAAALTVLATVAVRLRDGVAQPYLVLACTSCVLVLAMFPLYFRAANASFAAATIAPDRVAGELGRWARWHWLRTSIAAAGFAAALLASR
jgi:hypothetical protein